MVTVKHASKNMVSTERGFSVNRNELYDMVARLIV